MQGGAAAPGTIRRRLDQLRARTMEKQLSEALEALRKAETNALLFPRDEQARALVERAANEVNRLREQLARAQRTPPKS